LVRQIWLVLWNVVLLFSLMGWLVFANDWRADYGNWIANYDEHWRKNQSV
jgi:hypothetical protein